MSDKAIELYPLPENWTWTTIGEITKKIEKINPREMPKQEFSYLDISGIDNKRNVVKEVKSYLGKNAPSRARQVVRANDILFSTVRTYLRNVALVPKQYDGQVASTGFSILRANEGIESKYLFYFVLSRDFLEKLNTFQRGTSYPAVRDQDVRVQPIPLPSLNEQRRIVAKIEELFSELDAGVAALKQARAQLKRYRQALLKAAFEGLLTADWRRAHAGELEPAPALLARIRAQREARGRAQLAAWEEAVRAWEASGRPGRKPKKPRKPKELPPLTEEERAALPELPEGWAWVRLNNLAKVITDGNHQAPPKTDEGIPFIVISNIKDNTIDFSDTMYVSEEYFNGISESRKPRSGDILYTVTGSFGIPVLLNFDKKFCFQRHIGLIRLEDEINKEYIFNFLRSPFAMKQATLVATGTAQKTVTLTGLRSFLIPLPPQNECAEIVNLVERELSVIDHLDQTIEQALARAAALRQAILKRAFAGRLAPQDPDDEPAGELLARLRA